MVAVDRSFLWFGKSLTVSRARRPSKNTAASFMSYRTVAVWLFIGLSLVAAWDLTAPEPASLFACGLESFAGEDPLIIYLDGRRRDKVADVVFGDEK
jgi:hypothetical protein